MNTFLRAPYSIAHYLLAATGLWYLIANANAADPPTAFVGAKIIPIAGEEIASGTLLIADGKIVAVGPADGVKIPGRRQTRSTPRGASSCRA